MISKNYLFFSGNSVDAERVLSVTDENLARQVMMVVNARK